MHKISPLHVDEGAMEAFFPGKILLRELYGKGQNIVNPQEISVGGGVAIVKEKNDRLISLGMHDLNIEWAAGQIDGLNRFCADRDCDFLYVSLPSSKGYPGIEEGYGVDSDIWSTRELFLEQLRKEGVPILDIRQHLEQEGWQRDEIFYKTDHHWTTDSGLFTAGVIAETLKNDYGLKADTDLLSEEMYAKEKLSNCWLGEMGRAYSRTWTGTLDDFTIIKPTFPTKLKYKGQEGDFSILMDESHYTEHPSLKDLYDVSLHYSYLPECGAVETIHNELQEDGPRILLIRDSFSQVVAPFLALGVKDITLWNLRDEKAGLLEEIINGKYDVVICAYTDFWVEDLYDFADMY